MTIAKKTSFFPTVASALFLGCAHSSAGGGVESTDMAPQIAHADHSKAEELDTPTYQYRREGGAEESADESSESDTNSESGSSSLLQVKNVDSARQIAEDSVATKLSGDFRWETSPVLPVSWPESGKKVAFLFFPLSENPSNLDVLNAFSAAYRVDVDLTTGDATVVKLGKPKLLGEAQFKRTTFSERENLESLQRFVYTCAASDEDENPTKRSFAPYKNYLAEFPVFASEIEAQVPEFVRWLDGRQR